MRTSARACLAAGVVALAGCSMIWPAHYKLLEAEALEANGQYPEAVARYEEVFTNYPKKREALTALSRAAALCEERLNNWQKAAAYLQDLRTRTEGKPQYASVLLRLGNVLEHAGTPFKDSLETYGVLCKNCATAPEAMSALLARGRLHESMQDWAAAKGVYEDALARYGKSAEAPTVRMRLEAVWQFEAVGLYYAGEVEHAVALAEEAMKKGVTVDEVRNGIEALLTRYRKARRLWWADVALVTREETTVSDQPDPGCFVRRYERGVTAAAPAGWTVTYNAKKKTLIMTECPPPAATAEVVAAGMEPATSTAAGKAAGKASAKAKPKVSAKRAVKRWSWWSPASVQVLGYWFSPDGRYLGWIGKSRESRKRTLNILDLKRGKAWIVLSDPAGAVLGDIMAFLPFTSKIVFPYGNYFVVSDLRGGNRTNFSLDADKGRKAVFRARDVEWLATTADGLEVILAASQPPGKKRKGVPTPETKGLLYWKVGLGVGSF